MAIQAWKRWIRGAVHPISWSVNAIFYRAQTRAGRARIERVMVFKLDLLGDFLLALPALLTLRQSFPQAKFTYVVAPQGVEMARLLDGEVVSYESPFFHPYRTGVSIWRLWAMVRTLSRSAPDLIVDFRADPVSLLVALTAGARYRIEIGSQRVAPTARKFLGLPARSPVHESDIYTAAVNRWMPAHVRAAPDAWPSSLASDRLHEVRVGIGTQIAGLGASDYIVLHIGGSAAFKRWPVSRFFELAKRVRARHGLRSVLVGSPAERALVQGMEIDSVDGVDLVGRTGLQALFAVVAEARLVVANDSAVGHIASVVGRPVVTIYGGPSNPDAFAPRGRGPCRVIQPPCSCRSAEQDECVKGKAQWCLGRVTIDEVEAMVDEVLLSVSMMEAH